MSHQPRLNHRILEKVYSAWPPTQLWNATPLAFKLLQPQPRPFLRGLRILHRLLPLHSLLLLFYFLSATVRRNFTVWESTVSAAVSASTGVERRGARQPRNRPRLPAPTAARDPAGLPTASLPCPSSVPVGLCSTRQPPPCRSCGATADRAITTLSCSCRHHERWRSWRLLADVAPSRSPDMATAEDNTKKGQHTAVVTLDWSCSVVVVVRTCCLRDVSIRAT